MHCISSTQNCLELCRRQASGLYTYTSEINGLAAAHSERMGSDLLTATYCEDIASYVWKLDEGMGAFERARMCHEGRGARQR